MGATAHISEARLEPVLAALLRQFPFRIRGFHSDNGSEFINQSVAKLLNKLLIEQTKSRPRHSNDKLGEVHQTLSNLIPFPARLLSCEERHVGTCTC